MIISAENVDFSQLSPQVIIVGGGAAGLLGAVYFASRDISVLLLEAGPEQLDPGSQSVFHAAASLGRKHAGLHQGRFRALGGTTNLWGGQLVRFERDIFSHRPWVSDVAWPLDFDQIEPFYEECERLLGLPNEIRGDNNVISKLRLPSEYKDEDLEYFFTRWLTEKNFRFRFHRALASDKNITVVTNAPVVSLKLSGDFQEVAGVAISLPHGVIEANAPHVVLANGTIELVSLLQQRTTGGAAAPWSQNRWLGRSFMDHLEGTIASILPINQRLFRNLFDNVFLHGTKLQPRLRLSERCRARERLLGAAIHVKFGSEEHIENAKIFVRGLLKGRFSSPQRILPEFWAALRLGTPMAWHYLLNRRIWSSLAGEIDLKIMLEHAPMPTSTVKLSDKIDKYGMRIPELNWAIDTEQEVRTVQAAANLAKRYFETRQIAKVTIPDDIKAAKTELLDSFVDTFHHMGGARMALSERDGVVDSAGRVFGCRNLYVMGAATFPVAGFANPTLTALALALRTAESITQRVASG